MKQGREYDVIGCEIVMPADEWLPPAVRLGNMEATMAFVRLAVGVGRRLHSGKYDEFIMCCWVTFWPLIWSMVRCLFHVWYGAFGLHIGHG